LNQASSPREVSIMRLGFAKINPQAKIPASGEVIVLNPCTSVELQPSEIKKVKTGLVLDIPSGYIFSVFSHPSLVDQDVEVFTGQLFFNESFKGELIIPLKNSGRNQINLQPAHPIALGSLSKVENIHVEEFVSAAAGNRNSQGTSAERRGNRIKFEVK
jgi:dUTPase